MTEIDLKLLSLIRRRDKAETRLSIAEGLNQKYFYPSIHRYERDVAEELIKDHKENGDFLD